MLMGAARRSAPAKMKRVSVLSLNGGMDELVIEVAVPSSDEMTATHQIVRT
jgi:hypothetical protein